MTRRLFALVSIMLLAVSCGNKKDIFMFSYFSDQAFGLKLAYSMDGYHFTEIDKKDGTPFMAPILGNDKLLRDPSIIKGADGLFHMVWTTGWHDRIIGHASSADLVNWSEQQVIPVMAGEPEARNSWAPELYYDEPSGLYYIFWATTIPGKFPGNDDPKVENGLNHRIYAVTTKDFTEYSDTFLFFEPGFSVIDAAIVRSPLDGSIIMAFKNETPQPAEKNIRISKRLKEDGSLASSLTEGTWGPVSEPISGEIWAEGPSPVFIADTLMVYYDQFTNNTYGISRSTDNGNTWEIVPREMYCFPAGVVRHGTVFKISEEEFDLFKSRL